MIELTELKANYLQAVDATSQAAINLTKKTEELRLLNTESTATKYRIAELERLLRDARSGASLQHTAEELLNAKKELKDKIDSLDDNLILTPNLTNKIELAKTSKREAGRAARRIQSQITEQATALAAIDAADNNEIKIKLLVNLILSELNPGLNPVEQKEKLYHGVGMILCKQVFPCISDGVTPGIPTKADAIKERDAFVDSIE